MNFRVGDLVKVVAKVEKPSDKLHNWYSRWHPHMDSMVGLTCRILELDWYENNGHGAKLRDPRVRLTQHSTQQINFYFPLESLTMAIEGTESVFFDKDGFAEKSRYNGGISFIHQDGYSIVWEHDSSCCGVAQLGHFNIKNDAVSETLIKNALNYSVTQRKGVIKSTLIRLQGLPIEALKKCGFVCRSAFRNPNSGNTVYEYEHRTFSGAVDVPVA